MESCDRSAASRATGAAALRHLAEVAAGLHAAVLGETQVLGQVRDALALSDAGLRRIGNVALTAARDLRREAALKVDTSIGLERALLLAGVTASGTILILGAGHVGRGVASRARGLGFERLVVGVRNAPNRDLPPGADSLVDLDRLDLLGPVEVAVGCLGDRNGPTILHDVPPARLYVDLGTPANFDSLLDNRVSIATLTEREPAAVRTERERLRVRLRELLERRVGDASETSSTPSGRLRREVEAIRVREARAIVRRHPEIPAETVEAITRRLVNQIFHLPSARLKAHRDSALSEHVADLFAQPSEGAQ